MNILIAILMTPLLALVTGLVLTFWYILTAGEGGYEIEDEEDES